MFSDWLCISTSCDLLTVSSLCTKKSGDQFDANWQSPKNNEAHIMRVNDTNAVVLQKASACMRCCCVVALLGRRHYWRHHCRRASCPGLQPCLRTVAVSRGSAMLSRV